MFANNASENEGLEMNKIIIIIIIILHKSESMPYHLNWLQNL